MIEYGPDKCVEHFGRRLFYVARTGAPKSVLESTGLNALQGCARFTVLGEYIDHHVKEEETDMFPKVRKAHMNLATLGKSMAARREELKVEMGVTPYDEVPGFASNGAEKRASLWERITSVTTPRVSR